MADFCKQCSTAIFGRDEGDLAALGDPAMLQEGVGWSVLCEGCGNTVVDHDGRCIATYCPTHGAKEEKGDE